MGSFLVVMSIIFLGEWISTRTRTIIPSLFVMAVLFMIGFWTVFPKDIVADASFGNTFASICIPLLLVHLGTTMNIRELLEQWKAVVIALLGVAGTIVLCLTIGVFFFDWHTVLASVPSLVGGMVAAILMSENLKSISLDNLISLPIYMLMFHGIIGYPLTSHLLKKEGQRLKKNMPVNSKEINVVHLEKTVDHPKFIEKLPKDYKTAAFILARTGLVAFLAIVVALLLKNAINSNILCLVFGVVFSQLGFLEKNVLNKAGVFNWLMYGLTAYIFAQLSTASPSDLLNFIPEIIVLMLLSILGMYIVTRLVHRFFGFSKEMALATALTAFFGFPADFIITNDVIKEISETPEQEAYLTSQIMPKMLVSGFATVSIASIVVASIFIKLF